MYYKDWAANFYRRRVSTIRQDPTLEGDPQHAEGIVLGMEAVSESKIVEIHVSQDSIGKIALVCSAKVRSVCVSLTMESYIA